MGLKKGNKQQHRTPLERLQREITVKADQVPPTPKSVGLDGLQISLHPQDLFRVLQDTSAEHQEHPPKRKVTSR